MWQQLKNAVFPDRHLPVPILGGPARGAVAYIRLRHELRMVTGVYEAELHPALRELARPGVAAFDIGSAGGFYAVVLARMTGARVLAVEADPALAPVLRQLHERVPAVTALSALCAATPGPGAVTLDGLAQEHFAPGLVKMDIEGGEADALAGAGRLLGEVRPAWIIETHGQEVENACAERLRAAGYGVEIINPTRSEVVRRGLGEENRWIVARPYH